MNEIFWHQSESYINLVSYITSVFGFSFVLCLCHNYLSSTALSSHNLNRKTGIIMKRGVVAYWKDCLDQEPKAQPLRLFYAFFKEPFLWIIQKIGFC